MEDLMNVHELLGKIDYEGGYTDALDYGIRINEYDIPKEIQQLWAEMREAYLSFAEIRDELDSKLEEYADTVPFEED